MTRPRASVDEILSQVAKMQLGIWFVGLGTAGFGLACLLQGDFAVYWQIVPAGFPFRQPLAYLSATAHIVAGLGLLNRRTARVAIVVVIGLWLLFAASYLFFIFPWLGIAEHLAVAVGAAAIWSQLSPIPLNQSRVWPAFLCISYGIFSIVFGVMHFLALNQTAVLIPGWMPGDPIFWAEFTGLVHIGAGLALITRKFAVLATRMAGVMYLVFAAIVWTPASIIHQTEWLRWAGDAFTIAMLGGVWSLGDYLSSLNAGAPREQSDVAVPA